MTLAQALPVGAEDERQVREHGRRRAERLVHQDLLRGIREVVGASDDVGHPHVEVIGHHAQVVGGVPVRAQQNEIFEVPMLDPDAAKDAVIEAGLARLRHAKAQGTRAPLSRLVRALVLQRPRRT